MTPDILEQRPTNQIRKSHLVGTWQSLSLLSDPVRELTTAVNKEKINKMLAGVGFAQSGEVDLSHVTGGRPFVWDIYEGNFVVPKFPKVDESVSGIVGVSRQIDREGPDNSVLVLGRFAMDPIPQDKFTQDIEMVYNGLVYHPQKSTQEKLIQLATTTGCIIMPFATVAGVGLLAADIQEGWIALGVVAALGVASMSLQDKEQQLKNKRIDAELAKLSDSGQYFAGREVGDRLDNFKSTATHNMFMRAVYDVAQETLGSVKTGKFSEEFKIHMPYVTYDEKNQYIAEYGAYRDGDLLQLSQSFQGFCEINIGYLRRALAQPSNNVTKFERKSEE